MKVVVYVVLLKRRIQVASKTLVFLKTFAKKFPIR